MVAVMCSIRGYDNKIMAKIYKIAPILNGKMKPKKQMSYILQQ